MRYGASDNGFAIRATATGKVLERATPNFPVPPDLKARPKERYAGHEEIIRRLLLRDIRAGNSQSNAGVDAYQLSHDGLAIVDASGRVIVRAEPKFYSSQISEFEGVVVISEEEVIAALLMKDATAQWWGSAHCTAGFQKELACALLHVKPTRDGWIVLRDGALLHRRGETSPALFPDPHPACVVADRMAHVAANNAFVWLEGEVAK